MAMLDCRNVRPNEKVVDLFSRIVNIGLRAHHKFDPIWVIKFDLNGILFGLAIHHDPCWHLGIFWLVSLLRVTYKCVVAA